MAVADVVKYNGPAGVFAWKYPSEDLGTWTRLIVNESQEAILFKNGVALDVFTGGKYVLDTDSIPILNKFIKIPFGGKAPFSAEVWFVNKLFKLDIRWGTPSPIQMQDPKFGIVVPIRANGMFGIKVEDSKKLLSKLVGTMSVFDEDSIVRYFRGLYVTKVKDILSSYMIKKNIGALEINAYLDELSMYMKEEIKPEMEEYGISLVGFYINEVSMPEDDSSVKMLKNALAKKAEMNIIGTDFQQERTLDAMNAAASNESLGAMPFVGAGMGIGVGRAVADTMSNMTNKIMEDFAGEETLECPNCRTKISKGQKFCGECGENLESIFDNSKRMITCTNCGTQNTGAKFCINCGNKLL